jgi:hypothetical protein
MSDDTAVPYGTSFSFEGGFCAVVVATAEDFQPLDYTQGFAQAALCLLAIANNGKVPGHCLVIQGDAIGTPGSTRRYTVEISPA